MHIPDSVLSPTTTAVAGVAMLPIWALAGRHVRATLQAKQVPLLALGAAFCFTIMMFNIPALGGTTAHPVAGTLLAVLLGPWAATIGVSVALAIQALFFGDGGLLAYGANCFTMAFVLPFVGYSIYRLLAGRSDGNSPIRPLCAAVGAYIGLNAAAAVVAVLLGIQPVLFHEPNGQPLYFPFGLKITLPAMLGAHLLIAGPAEAMVTALVVAYLQRAGFALYGASDRTDKSVEGNRVRRGQRREALWIGLLALVALSPLGLLAKGDAWGEWDQAGIKQQIKRIEGKEYVPRGLAQVEEQEYKGVRGLSDYASDRGWKGYLGAAALGVGTIVIVLLLAGKALAGRSDNPNDAGPGSGGPGSGTREPAENGSDSDAGSTLPDWLRRPSEEGVTPAPPGKAANPFLGRTLEGLSSGAAVALQSERWAKEPGYLQRLDPRAKVVGFLGLIAVVSWVHHPVTLLGLVALTLFLALASRLPIGMLVRRVWLSVPVFVGALALPEALNVVTPGRPLLTLWHHPYLSVTVPGLEGAALLMLRVGVAISLGSLLTLTTRWNDLARAMRALCVPRLFVWVMMMTYRYLAVLMQAASEMFVARRSRTVGPTTNAAGRRFVGASMGALFGKTMALADEVHAAMVSRGFQGDVRTLTVLRWRVADTAWTAAVLLVATLSLGIEWGGLRVLHLP